MAYISQFGKHYSSIEQFNFRFGQFLLTYIEVLSHNEIESTWKSGFNHMSDWSEEEKLNVKMRADPHFFGELEKADNTKPSVISAEAIANTIDWRTSGAVNPIKN